ncbi:meiotic recombination protein REC114 [Pholidichthys leucotaenia]
MAEGAKTPAPSTSGVCPRGTVKRGAVGPVPVSEMKESGARPTGAIPRRTKRQHWNPGRTPDWVSDEVRPRARPWLQRDGHRKPNPAPLRIGEAVQSRVEARDTIPLVCDSLKINQKSDNLMFQFTVKGERRMIRMQFDGRSRAEAINECSSAVGKLKEYVPVSTQDEVPPKPNQSPADVPAPPEQACQKKAVGTEPEVVHGSVSIKRLTQHFLGDAALTLPKVYHHSPLTQGDLEPLLRDCLLDPSFCEFVEKVEGELRKLLED